MRYKVNFTEAGSFRKGIKCQDACPVGTDACGYVRAIAEGNLEKAYLAIRGPNPLASICGRICGAPCESACRRGNIDEPVSIRVLKRFALERYHRERRSSSGFLRELLKNSGARGRLGCENMATIAKALRDKELHPAAGEKIAIIGAGPAGLAAAHDLALLGFKPVLFEKEATPGGMLTVGIPEFRLPREVIEAEVKAIVRLGAEIRCNVSVGEDIAFTDIRKEHRATIIAVGAKNSKSLGIPGEDAEGVFGGVEFLRELALDRRPKLKMPVVVIGGGNTAMDCSRCSLRVGAGEVVSVLYRRTRDEMPVNADELHEAEQEGVRLKYLLTPLRIEMDVEGRATGVRLQENRLGEADASGRRRPVPIPGAEIVEPCGSVILAIGQDSDLSFVNPERDGLTFNKWGLIDCNDESLGTSAPDVFMAGDAALGAKLVIDAVASGKQAARSVYQFIMGRAIGHETTERLFPLHGYSREANYEGRTRASVPTLPVEQRLRNLVVEFEHPFSPEEAQHEAERCLDCGVNTIFDSRKCLLCGGCVDVCPEGCLRIVSVSRLLADDKTRAALDRLCGDTPPREVSAIIKNDERCIRCAECADRCPVGAITMQQVSFEGKWHEQATNQAAF
jgi:NADPH-dependent glutamate synthase beta subunit-like oxidoreductase